MKPRGSAAPISVEDSSGPLSIPPPKQSSGLAASTVEVPPPVALILISTTVGNRSSAAGPARRFAPTDRRGPPGELPFLCNPHQA